MIYLYCIQAFLEHEEATEDGRSGKPLGSNMAAGHVELRGLVASWATSNVLSSLDLELEPGTLCAVIGPVGSGKVTYNFTERISTENERNYKNHNADSEDDNYCVKVI